ncbi:MAG: adenylate/guanylate cyclase domain-containing protein, partial [Solirubrobacterales bacterium]
MPSAYVEPEWAMVTVLFVDIRGFTAFADRSTAREAVAYLNDFFELAVPALARHGGHANKLLGDGFLGV